HPICGILNERHNAARHGRFETTSSPIDMNKRTYASLTERLCECRYLENAANDPDSPIRFEESTGEYHFVYDEKRQSRLRHLLHAIWGRSGVGGMLVIYHCPFCGGAAPESKRHLLFEAISQDEESRLAELMEGINSIEDATKRMGQPDFVGHSATRVPESESGPPKVQHHRTIQYHRLSELAEIWITERPDGSVSWHLQGKLKSIPDGT
ncbi:MAG: hypothetical protein KDA59_08080, partial [Planctomycetales bacterium]|nr:hypothetical protein [Planctomycetales bacterium]